MDLDTVRTGGWHDSALGDDVAAVRALYEAQADREWARLDKDIKGRVSFEVHRRLLARVLRPGDRVLEIGAGPGRFTIALAAMGARVTVTDLSASQLVANTERVRDAGCEHAVEARFELDVRDVSRFADGEFAAVIAFGGLMLAPGSVSGVNKEAVGGDIRTAGALCL